MGSFVFSCNIAMLLVCILICLKIIFVNCELYKINYKEWKKNCDGADDDENSMKKNAKTSSDALKLMKHHK